MNPIISAIISSILETIQDTPSTVPPQYYAPPGLVRPSLQTGPLAVMGPPENGYAQFGGQTLHLAANLQIRDTQNRIILPVSIEQAMPVLYKLDANGSVQRVWVLTPEEAEVAERVLRQRSSSSQ
jgi:hypothetical protein